MNDNNKRRLLETNRIEALSDAIFAVAMTLLILSIDIPDIPQWKAGAELGQKLLAMIPTFFTFALSFILLAVFWSIHLKQFESIKKIDEKLAWMNIFLLLFVVFVPFSTSLMEKYNTTIAALFFHINLLTIGLIYFWHWHYAVRNHLVDTNLSIDRLKIINRKNLVTPLVAIMAIIISFFYPASSSMVYISIPLVLMFIDRNNN